MSRALPCLLILCAALAASETAGPFTVSAKHHDAGAPASWAIARDGTVAAATLAAGDAAAGTIDVALWAGDNQAAGRSAGGINLFGPAGETAWLGLNADWRIGEGTDGPGGWIYYTKFQQDALLVMGYAACAPGELPTADGAGFAVHDAQSWDRILLVLPWRWVQGGGSTWQTGSYGGNPPQAGVWAVPAGMSLADAAREADTWRLADLRPLLDEVQPHIWSTRFRLQLTGIGGWQVEVDIDGDGQIDHRTHGAAAGNLVSPFTALDEASGLIVSTRSAMGNHGGTVGRTDYGLAYQIAPVTGGRGLKAAFYDLPTWFVRRLPDLSDLEPDLERIDATLDYPATRWAWTGLPRSMRNTFASRHRGLLEVVEPGTYTLELRSDDGSRLALGGEWILDNDGLHGMRRRRVELDLTAGYHPLVVDFFENYGRAGLILSWTRPDGTREVVPEERLHHGRAWDPTLIDRRPFTVHLPVEVKSSPVIVDGRAWGEDYAVTARAPTLGSTPVPVSRISERDFFIDLPLDPDAPTTVTFAQSGTPAPTISEHTVEWVPIDMYHDEDLTIRVGDSVKLQCLVSCGTDPVEIDADGDGSIDHTGTGYDEFVHRYDSAGVYEAKALASDGSVIGTSTITVAEVRLPVAIACQVGFTRTVTIHTGVHNPEDLFVTANDPELLLVTQGEDDSNHLRVTIKVNGRGSPVLQVRQGSNTGPLLAAREIDEFVLQSTDLQTMVINATERNAGGILTIKPYIPGLKVDMSMFANKASFLNTETAQSLTTEDFTTRTDVDGELVADYHVQLLVPPSEDSFCFKTIFRQENQEWVNVGKTLSNGSGMEIEVDKSILWSADSANETATGYFEGRVVKHRKDSGSWAVSIHKGDDAKKNAHGEGDPVFEDSGLGNSRKNFRLTTYDDQKFNVVTKGSCARYNLKIKSTFFRGRMETQDAEISAVGANGILKLDYAHHVRLQVRTSGSYAKLRLSSARLHGTKGRAEFVANAGTTASLDITEGRGYNNDYRVRGIESSVVGANEDAKNIRLTTTLKGLVNALPEGTDAVDCATIDVTVVDRKVIHLTDKEAPGPVTDERTTVGVYEEVVFHFGSEAHWFIQKQDGTMAEGTATADYENRYIMKHRASALDNDTNTGTFRLTYRYTDTDDYEAPILFTIIKPTEIHYDLVSGSEVPIAAGRLGCKFEVQATLGPDTVSFGNLHVREVGTGGPTGSAYTVKGTYFETLEDTHDLDHYAGGPGRRYGDYSAGRVLDDNRVRGTGAGIDHVGYVPFENPADPGNWTESGYPGAGDVPTKLVWPIQHQYRAGDSTNDIDMNVETKQVFVIGLGRRADGQPGYETIMAVFKVGASTASMSRGIQSGQYRE